MHNDTDFTLTNLAREYRRAAGECYAAGDDEQAAKLRLASDKIDALRAALPPLPTPKVATRGG